MLSTSIVLALLGCGSPPPDPSLTPQGRLCGRAYGSTVDSLQELADKNGVDMPAVAAKKDYVEKCVGMGFTDDQLKCLDPKIAQGDMKGCGETLKDVEAKKKELSQLLIKKGAAPAPAPAEPAPAEPAPAEPTP